MRSSSLQLVRQFCEWSSGIFGRISTCVGVCLLIFSLFWGLFKNNIAEKVLKKKKKKYLNIKKIFNDRHFPILIDAEGGKVSRINKILDISIFSQDYFSSRQHFFE